MDGAGVVECGGGGGGNGVSSTGTANYIPGGEALLSSVILFNPPHPTCTPTSATPASLARSRRMPPLQHLHCMETGPEVPSGCRSHSPFGGHTGKIVLLGKQLQNMEHGKSNVGISSTQCPDDLAGLHTGQVGKGLATEAQVFVERPVMTGAQVSAAPRALSGRLAYPTRLTEAATASVKHGSSTFCPFGTAAGYTATGL